MITRIQLERVSRAVPRSRGATEPAADREHLQGNNDAFKALEFFKDWSNYLLVTTVAALGWSSAADVDISDTARSWCVGLFAAPIAFGIFTLALIPLVTQKVKNGQSVFEVQPEFDLLWLKVQVTSIRLKHVCWWQHVLFLVGIVVYAAGVRPA